MGRACGGSRGTRATVTEPEPSPLPLWFVRVLIVVMTVAGYAFGYWLGGEEARNAETQESRR